MATLRPSLGIMRLDQRQQPTSRHHRIHLRQEQFPPRLLLFHRIAKTGKGGLVSASAGLHTGMLNSTRSGQEREVFQMFPYYKDIMGLTLSLLGFLQMPD